ncbi:hypothetical protein CROQUDRAFT_655249 [Cronartium quercuum f. sp. fusiforme G11]|uniref:Uncharacterized protein n=1 Tax=Cronartium quercuum f. sp. fusiforme G11 TaxID=708437 RepID=A0A9P6NLB5_9BASI|nr:hypothetical protein CROQUDRAFT_655249 [Cronartium quercuum f. sp. fusiforme G11]
MCIVSNTIKESVLLVAVCQVSLSHPVHLSPSFTHLLFIYLLSFGFACLYKMGRNYNPRYDLVSRSS